MSQEPDVARRRVVITNAYGFHVRPIQKFVVVAAKFRAEIRVHFQGQAVNGKSILELLTMNADFGSELELEARGPDAAAAVGALAELVEARFHETEPDPSSSTDKGSGPPTGPPEGPAS